MRGKNIAYLELKNADDEESKFANQLKNLDKVKN